MYARTLTCRLFIILAIFQAVATQDYFVTELVTKYGSNSKMNATQLEELIQRVLQAAPTRTAKASVLAAAASSGNVNTSVKLLPDSQCDVLDKNCLSTKCLSANDIFAFHMLPADAAANVSDLTRISPAVLYQLQNDACYTGTSTKHAGRHGTKTKPTKAETWGYGLLCVTIINICAALGVLFYPFMHTRIYKKILMGMVGLAVGTLSGSGIFVLIPETFELVTGESLVGSNYIWRAVAVVGGIYLFFTTERMLNFIIRSRTKKKSKEDPTSADGRGNPAFDGDLQDMKTSPEVTISHMHAEIKEVPKHVITEEPIKPLVQKWAPMSTIKSVAWMVVFGDALHNFVDGLSIGSAFADNTLAGVSISLAVFCEELPHELGDFAILLNSGMSIRQALLMNVLSAMTCYVGLVIGILVGSLEQGSLWIFGIAGGMFLYISLADMLPEMNDQAREEEERTGRMLPSYLIQNLGMLTGWAIILVLALFAGEIDFTA